MSHLRLFKIRGCSNDFVVPADMCPEQHDMRAAALNHSPNDIGDACVSAPVIFLSTAAPVIAPVRE